MNSPRLKPYHNPENVDESRVPKGWRFVYADELIEQKLTFSRLWRPGWSFVFPQWDCPCHRKLLLIFTYIVPVA